MLTAKYVNRANVSVVVKEYANKPVSVVGAVQSSGSLNISGRWTLLQAISAAGGLTGDAGRKIYVLRRSENGLTDTLEIDTDESLPHGVADVEHSDLSGGRDQRPAAVAGPRVLPRRGQVAGGARLHDATTG